MVRFLGEHRRRLPRENLLTNACRLDNDVQYTHTAGRRDRAILGSDHLLFLLSWKQFLVFSQSPRPKKQRKRVTIIVGLYYVRLTDIMCALFCFLLTSSFYLGEEEVAALEYEEPRTPVLEPGALLP